MSHAAKWWTTRGDVCIGCDHHHRTPDAAGECWSRAERRARRNAGGGHTDLRVVDDLGHVWYEVDPGHWIELDVQPAGWA